MSTANERAEAPLADSASVIGVALTLPDGSVRKFDGAVSGAELAADIGPGLAKAAIAVVVDGEVRDLIRKIRTDAEVSIVTRKDEQALELIRHDTAHVMAQAVQRLYPGTQVTIGPSIENGFYYDFAREEPFTPEDLEKIEDCIKSGDFKKYKNGQVKVFVRYKRSPYLFDRFLDKLYNAQVGNLTIIEDIIQQEIDDEDVIDMSKDTLTLILNEIDTMEEVEDTGKLKKIIQDLYMESLSL